MLQQVLATIRERLADFGGAPGFVRKLENPRLYLACAAVLLLHIAAIWILATGIVLTRGAGAPAPEMHVALVGSAPSAVQRMEPPPEPEMRTADSMEQPVEAPQIDAQTMAPGGAPGASTADILPPRPDPSFQNASPSLPAGHAKPGGPMEVMLTILVEADGSVRDARVAKSSGETVLDRLAIAFTKAKWRFRAALQQGHPVADWTTVLVRFALPG
jgi:TonB family protein